LGEGLLAENGTSRPSWCQVPPPAPVSDSMKSAESLVSLALDDPRRPRVDACGGEREVWCYYRCCCRCCYGC